MPIAVGSRCRKSKNRRWTATRHNLPALPLYPEGRACTRPTTQRIIELFEPIQRHELLRDLDANGVEAQEPLILTTKLTPLQREIAQLLGLNPADYAN